MIPTFQLGQLGRGFASEVSFNDNLVLHLRGEGADGSTTFTDSSPVGRSMTRSGTVTEISTDQAVFGSSSILCTGTANTDYLAASAASADFDFGSGDFTIRGWMYPFGVASTRFMLSNRPTGGDRGWFVGTNASGQLSFQCWTAAGGTLVVMTGGTVPANAWSFFAVSRNGANFQLYLGSVNVASGNGATTAIGDSTQAIRSHDPTTSGRQWQGHMQEVQVFKGVGIYPTSATVPTGPF